MMYPARFLLLLLVLILIGCKENDEVTGSDPDPEILLSANAGSDQTVEPLEQVTLDGSASKGPDGLLYTWTYIGLVPEEEINFQNRSSANPTFIPPVNGSYKFNLTISYGDSIDEDDVTILAEGSVKIGGTLTQDLELYDIRPNSSLPDYVVTGDLIVPQGKKLSIIADEVIVNFENGSGIIVSDQGIFTNEDPAKNPEFLTVFTATEGWKGILVENGGIFLEHALIENAGNALFDGYTEAGAIILSGETAVINSLSENEFRNSYSYDILAITRPTGPGKVLGNQFSYSIPLKSPISFMSFWSSARPNYFPEIYQYVHLIPGGTMQKDVIPGNFIFSSATAGKYYIDGDFWAGSPIIIEANCQIYMKQDAAIIADEGISTQGFDGKEITISGLNTATWKGITGDVAFKGTIIEDAGYGRISTGSVEAEEEAAIYTSTDGVMQDCFIINSGGYGYYNANPDIVSFKILNTFFAEPAKAAIRTNTGSVRRAIGSEQHNNVFLMKPGVPAVLVQGDGFADGTWYALGGNNYYLIDADLKSDGSGDVVFEAGVNLKFGAARSLLWQPGGYQASLKILGTSDDPVIFDGEGGVPGSWGGLLLGGEFYIDHLIIKNGGGFTLPAAAVNANIISAYTLNPPTASTILKNSTISDSQGWGISIEPSTIDLGYDDPLKGNTFTNNQLGEIKK